MLSVNELLLVNFVLLTSNVSRYVQLEIKGAASSSTPVSFKTSVRSCGGPCSMVSGNKPTRQAERNGCMAPRLKDFRKYQRKWRSMFPFRLTLHLLPTRRTKSDIAPSVRSVKHSFEFPTKLMFSSCRKSCNISVSCIRVLFVIVKAEVFPIVALDPCRSPRAPNASVCKWGSMEMIASKSALETLVDVRESFVSGIFGVLKSETGCCTSVNDKSKRRRLGHLAMMDWSEASDKDVWRNLSVCISVRVTSCSFMPTISLVNVASV